MLLRWFAHQFRTAPVHARIHPVPSGRRLSQAVHFSDTVKERHGQLTIQWPTVRDLRHRLMSATVKTGLPSSSQMQEANAARQHRTAAVFGVLQVGDGSSVSSSGGRRRSRCIPVRPASR